MFAHTVAEGVQIICFLPCSHDSCCLIRMKNKRLPEVGAKFHLKLAMNEMQCDVSYPVAAASNHHFEALD